MRLFLLDILSIVVSKLCSMVFVKLRWRMGAGEQDEAVIPRLELSLHSHY